MDRGCLAVQIKIKEYTVRGMETKGQGGADDSRRPSSVKYG